MAQPLPSTPDPRGHDQHHDPVGREREETGTGAATRKMWVGGLSFTVLWGAVGAVIGFALAWAPVGSLPLGLRLLAYTVAGALAGSAAGFVYGAGRTRDVDVEARREVRFAPDSQKTAPPASPRPLPDD
jgi:hypothetical protein